MTLEHFGVANGYQGGHDKAPAIKEEKAKNILRFVGPADDASVGLEMIDWLEERGAKLLRISADELGDIINQSEGGRCFDLSSVAPDRIERLATALNKHFFGAYRLFSQDENDQFIPPIASFNEDDVVSNTKEESPSSLISRPTSAKRLITPKRKIGAMVFKEPERRLGKYEKDDETIRNENLPELKMPVDSEVSELHDEPKRYYDDDFDENDPIIDYSTAHEEWDYPHDIEFFPREGERPKHKKEYDRKQFFILSVGISKDEYKRLSALADLMHQKSTEESVEYFIEKNLKDYLRKLFVSLSSISNGLNISEWGLLEMAREMVKRFVSGKTSSVKFKLDIPQDRSKRRYLVKRVREQILKMGQKLQLQFSIGRERRGKRRENDQKKKRNLYLQEHRNKGLDAEEMDMLERGNVGKIVNEEFANTPSRAGELAAKDIIPWEKPRARGNNSKSRRKEHRRNANIIIK